MLERLTHEQRLQIARLIRGEGVGVKEHRTRDACQAVGFNCEEIDRRIGPCVQMYLRLYPSKTIVPVVYGRPQEGQRYSVPTDFKDAVDHCTFEGGKAIDWQAMLEGGLWIAIGLLAIIPKRRS